MGFAGACSHQDNRKILLNNTAGLRYRQAGLKSRLALVRQASVASPGSAFISASWLMCRDGVKDQREKDVGFVI